MHFGCLTRCPFVAYIVCVCVCVCVGGWVSVAERRGKRRMRCALFDRRKDVWGCSAAPEEFLQPLFLCCSCFAVPKVCVVVCVPPSAESDQTARVPDEGVLIPLDPLPPAKSPCLLCFVSSSRGGQRCGRFASYFGLIAFGEAVLWLWGSVYVEGSVEHGPEAD